MKGQKIAIVTGAAVAVLLCLAGAWVAYVAFSKADTAKGARDETLKQIESIYRRNPFPSATNVWTVKNDRQKLDSWNRAMEQRLRAESAAAATNDLTPSGFIDQLTATRRELLALAQSGGGKVLPDGFAFGFDQYLVASAMPRPDDVRRLTLQLRMVDALVRQILASHVITLTQTDRDVFENPGAAPATTPAAPAGSGRHHHGSTAAPVRVTAAATDGSYARQHFVLSFEGKEHALDDVLNRLAAMPMFVVVTDLEIHREERGLRLPPERAAVTEKEKEKPAALPRSQRVASGSDVAPLLKVQLQIDVYTFDGV